MSEPILIAMISGGCALLGSVVATIVTNNRTKALLTYRLDQIEKKQDKHNSIIEKYYILKNEIDVLSNREKVSEHRLETLEKRA